MSDRLETIEAYALGTIGAITGAIKYYIKEPIMEFLEGEQELVKRHNQADGLEVVLVWNSLINLAYSRVHDHKSDEEFTVVAPDGVHPKETFDHPYVYRVGEGDN